VLCGVPFSQDSVEILFMLELEKSIYDCSGCNTHRLSAVRAQVNEQMQQKIKRLHAQAATINALR
jgi:hypothetical protein